MLLKLFQPKKFRTREIPQGVSELYSLKVNGTSQWLLERGNNSDLPVLLLLHGGPGSTDMWLSEHCNAELEKHFIVVNWDQRGAGKSFNASEDPSNLTIPQFLDDAKVVVDHLLSKYGQPKLHLLGQSWGSVLGWYLARQIPEKLHRYIGVGQVTAMAESEDRSMAFVKSMAEKEGNTKALKQLNSIAIPIGSEGKGVLNPLMVQRKWLANYGGMMYGQKKITSVFKYAFQAKEYSLSDILKMNKGMQVTIDKMWPALLKLDFFNEETSCKVPVLLIHGDHDQTVNMDLAKDFFERIESPIKKMVWLDGAHMINITCPKEYSKVIVEELIQEIEVKVVDSDPKASFIN